MGALLARRLRRAGEPGDRGLAGGGRRGAGRAADGPGALRRRERRALRRLQPRRRLPPGLRGGRRATRSRRSASRRSPASAVSAPPCSITSPPTRGGRPPPRAPAGSPSGGRTATTCCPGSIIAGASWEDYLASRSRNLRSQVRRKTKALERDHDAVFRLAEEATLEADLATLVDLHERRWRGRGGSGALGEAPRRFHSGFAAAALRRGWLRLWILELRGEPAAALYGWRVGDRYSYYQAGLDPAYERRERRPRPAGAHDPRRDRGGGARLRPAPRRRGLQVPLRRRRAQGPHRRDRPQGRPRPGDALPPSRRFGVRAGASDRSGALRRPRSTAGSSASCRAAGAASGPAPSLRARTPQATERARSRRAPGRARAAATAPSRTARMRRSPRRGRRSSRSGAPAR